MSGADAGAGGSDPAVSAGAEARRRPLEWTARLGRELRREGVPSTVSDSIAASETLAHLDLGDALDVYLGLRSVFVSRPEDLAAFDRCFWALWGERQRQTPVSLGGRTDDPGADPPSRRGGPGGGERDSADGPVRRPRRGGGGEPWPAGRDGEGEEAESRPPVGAGYSPAEALARRSFASLDRHEVRQLDRVFDRLFFRLATRRSRRFGPSRRRGRVDVRRSFRDALRHDGELIRLGRRARRVERPRVVLLCDVSGSMERYARFLVRFLLSAGRDRDAETFVFSTRLVHLTPWLSSTRSLDEALDALSGRVPGWSGGTRMGECLEEFLDRHGRTLLGRRTIVVILSDGLDRGEVETLEHAMRGIQRRARKVVWLNPLLESADYRPEARGMKAALPFVDEFAPGHSLEALRDLSRMIRL